METFQPGLPLPDEYGPFYAGYIAKAAGYSDPALLLSLQLDEVLELLRPLDSVQQNFRYAPGKWSVKEVLGHVTDTERIFSYRALRISRGDQTPLPPFDENQFVPASEVHRLEWPDMLEEFEHVRRATVMLLRHLPRQAWIRRGVVSGTETSVRALAYVMAGHGAHHLGILRERYLRT